MGIFNQQSNNQPHQSFLRGLRGSPGVGFSLTRDGNYDMSSYIKICSRTNFPYSPLLTP